MLQSLTIQNLAIAKNVYTELDEGMNAITGETGAGKSIMLDALGLTLGNKAQSNMINQQSDKAHVTSVFDVECIEHAKNWLQDNELLNDEDPSQCVLKRVVDTKGKNKAFINGTPCTLKQLKEIGNLLIQIHGQHEHHQLLKKEYQLHLVDGYGNLHELSDNLQTLHKQRKQLNQQLDEKRKSINDLVEKKQLLEFQVGELEQLTPDKEEFDNIEQQIEQIENSEHIYNNSYNATQAISNDSDTSITSLLSTTSQLINDIKQFSNELEEIHQRLDSVFIEIQDIEQTLSQHIDTIGIDEQQAQEIKTRYEHYNQLSHKYKTNPEDLEALYDNLSQQLKDIENPDTIIEELEQQIQQIDESIEQQTQQLYEQRVKVAQQLEPIINQELNKLGFKEDTFSIQMNDKALYHNKDFLGFYIAPNVGQQPQPINSIASGGELSRISLAIQVVFSRFINAPTIIFDEVDVGVGGETANVVGKMLKTLSDQCQVVCITHLPQVACFCNHHVKVQKTHETNQTITELITLNEQQRTEEIARMLYGEQFTDSDLQKTAAMIKNA